MSRPLPWPRPRASNAVAEPETSLAVTMAKKKGKGRAPTHEAGESVIASPAPMGAARLGELTPSSV